ncbi:MAG: FHA domain-containing protein [Anaerolineae bacterium]|nr:FHA domain-containing protein [Anaerolineae bacterium]
MTNKGRLSQVEQRIAQLVEGGFARLFADRLQPREVAVRLARAMDDTAEPSPDGPIAPDAYLVYLNPDDLDALLAAHPDLDRRLAEGLVEIATRAGLRLVQTPTVAIRPDPDLPPHSVMVEAYHTRSEGPPTSVMEAVRDEDAEPPSAPARPRNAHLVLRGMDYIPLDKPIVTIGRRADNHIVIDDPRVSRAHAQLRIRFSRYVVYDLNSKGGTYVNGHRVSECILRPGDVISLAGVPLVYLEDDESATGLPPAPSDTQIGPPPRTGPGR